MLAARLMVSRATVQRWEAGQDYPSVSHIPGISRELGVSVYYLLGLRETPEFGIWPTSEEKVILEVFKPLNPANRRMLVEMAKDLHQVQAATAKKVA